MSGHHSDLFKGAVFILICLVYSEVENLSWNLYSNFVIKEAHGFNKMTLGLFFGDQFKSLVLTLIFGSIVYYGLMRIIEWAGTDFYWYLLGFIVAFLLLFVNIVPNFIMPLFNKFDPLPQGPLRDKIEEIAKEIQFPLTQIYVIDASKRSSHSNAYYFGFGNNKRIVLFDTLIEQHQGEQGILEIASVVKHELGHWYHMHPLKSMIVTIFNLAFMFKVFDLILNSRALNRSILANMGFSRESVFISLLIFTKLFETI